MANAVLERTRKDEKPLVATISFRGVAMPVLIEERLLRRAASSGPIPPQNRVLIHRRLVPGSMRHLIHSEVEGSELVVMGAERN